MKTFFLKYSIKNVGKKHTRKTIEKQNQFENETNLPFIPFWHSFKNGMFSYHSKNVLNVSLCVASICVCLSYALLFLFEFCVFDIKINDFWRFQYVGCHYTMRQPTTFRQTVKTKETDHIKAPSKLCVCVWVFVPSIHFNSKAFLLIIIGWSCSNIDIIHMEVTESTLEIYRFWYVWLVTVVIFRLHFNCSASFGFTVVESFLSIATHPRHSNLAFPKDISIQICGCLFSLCVRVFLSDF